MFSVNKLILSPSSHASSDNHSSYHPTIIIYFYVSWLKHKSFYFVASISHTNSIIVFLSPSHWHWWCPQSVLNVQHFSITSGFISVSSAFILVNKLFNYFKAVFNTAGNLRLSILFFKRSAIILTTANIVSFKKTLSFFNCLFRSHYFKRRMKY